MLITRVVKVCCFLFFIAPFTGLSQSVSKTVSDVAESIAKAGSLGFDQDAQYSHFVILNNVSTEEELVVLTSNDSPAVRGYAFWALAKRDYIDLKSIFIRFAAKYQKGPQYSVLQTLRTAAWHIR